MLSIYFGERDIGLGVPDAFFNLKFDRKLLLEDFSRRVIKGVDKSEVFDENVIISPVLGGILPEKLSRGTKNLLIAKYYHDKIINWCFMGDNCISYLCEIANSSDIEINATCFYNPFYYGYKGKVRVVNDGSYVDNIDDFLDAWHKYRGW